MNTEIYMVRSLCFLFDDWIGEQIAIKGKKIDSELEIQQISDRLMHKSHIIKSMQ